VYKLQFFLHFIGLTASEKLGIIGAKLIREKGGMEIDEDDVLCHVLRSNDSKLILLRDGETWKPETGIFTSIATL